MRHPFRHTGFAALTSLLCIGCEALAQGNPPRFEIGAQFSLLTVNKPTAQFEEFASGDVVAPGFGARFTYNLTTDIAFEAEGNYFPERNFEPEGSWIGGSNNVPGGHIFQGQFGVKVGKRFKKLGLFLKVRPGFVRFSKVIKLIDIRLTNFIHPSTGRNVLLENAEFGVGKATYLSTDLGGVVSYPSRKIVTRLDIGDTIIRYGVYREPLGIVCALSAPCPTQVFERPAEIRHNLQFSAGIGFRF